MSTVVPGILLPLLLHAQSVLINELQADGAPADRVELLNTSDQHIDIGGFILFLHGLHHRIVPPLVIAPRGFVVLQFDRHTEAGNDHIGLKLPREGATLLLIDADGSTILDAFTYPALPEGVSVGRGGDGARSIAYFTTPTFGTSNRGSIAALRLLAPPRIELVVQDAGQMHVHLSAETGTAIGYALDGSALDPMTATRYDGPFAVDAHRPIVAMAFAEDGIASTPSCRVFHPEHPLRTPQVSLVIDPDDLVDPDRGINVEGLHGNYAQRGKEWERDAFVQFPEDAQARPVRVRINGSGSRGYPKRSFRIDPVDDNDPRSGGSGITAHHALILRADATPHAFLRNVFMEQVAAASGARVDVQPSTPVQLFLNGSDHGLYRRMPAKNPAWVRSLGGAEAIDLLEGPAADVIAGDRDHFEHVLQVLSRGGPLDTLEAYVDVGSLIDLACFDLYTGRADHDLNVRCWRPRVAAGRWRWILFDMDLWAPVDENSVERFCASGIPEAPYVPQLLAFPGSRNKLLARMTALLHATLAPENAVFRMNELIRDHAQMMQQDHERWSTEMASPTPSESAGLLLDFVAHRPALLLEHLGRELDRTVRSFEISVMPPGAGTIHLEDLSITDDRSRIAAIEDVPLVFEARPVEGMEFAGWSGAPSEGPLITVDPARMRTLEARFRPMGTSRRDGLEQAGE